jgi:hypothetical protein
MAVAAPGSTTAISSHVKSMEAQRAMAFEPLFFCWVLGLWPTDTRPVAQMCKPEKTP